MDTHQAYSFEQCREHCPKAAMDWADLAQDLELALQNLNLDAILKKRFKPFLFHHILKIGLAGCPNACSRPQIKDISLTGFVTPQLSDNSCSGCQTCVSVCLEKAITWENDVIVIDTDLCVSCGECIRNCLTEKIVPQESGWILSLGGRLGRHPQLAKFVSRVTTDKEAKDWLVQILNDYCTEGLTEERFSHFLGRRKWVHEPNRS
ncbi:4Fe-4S dicluster domain-containing protein [Desulfitobacterium sp.]|uniref:4Fe-4S dicluster domain-containing protein n=1 Tax=Desulfitobacterium sp. TaxID=49981 RepID=UPI002C891088|nr:4Fe-4S dicluster domain-containing protein [Desulfitobacterium sp.]HVJ48629.1 4Fe-4S dicluster domain-containing protein [Desulfitobacterium sp.]